ncbi:fimbrial protein [Enterobacter sp. 22452]|uniref:fimbrial protein n=1 Tax=Enterobacter TaxID=547 RepID=UPI003F86FDC1
MRKTEGLFPVLLATCLALASGSSQASEGPSINISGIVVAASCTIDSDTVDKQVTLPKTQAHSMADAGTGSDWVDFNLNLSACPAYLQSVTVKFTGTPDDKDNTTYKNTGDAQNVSLQLAARTTNYGNGSTMKVDVDSATHTAVFPLSARIYSPTGGATLGTFGAVVSLDFTYQ